MPMQRLQPFLPSMPSPIDITISRGIIINAASILGSTEICFGVDTHDLECIDLLAYAHVAELARDLTTHHTGKHDTHQCWGEFKNHSVADNLCNGRLGNDGARLTGKRSAGHTRHP